MEAISPQRQPLQLFPIDTASPFRTPETSELPAPHQAADKFTSKQNYKLCQLPCGAFLEKKDVIARFLIKS